MDFLEPREQYINGHGDAMGGAIIGKTKYLDIIRAQSQINLGATIRSFLMLAYYERSSNFTSSYETT